MWLDRRGRVYLTAGNEGSDHGAPYARTIFNHVHYYDPDTGQFGQRTGWKLQSQHAIDAAQCFQTPRVCYLADNLGTVYRFMDPDPATGKMSWKRIGGVGQTTVATYGNNWVFHVDAKQTRAYLLTRRGKLFEMDLNSGAILRKIDFYVAEPGFKAWYAYGHDAWDAHGRFYFAAFKSLSTSTGVRLVAMDPQRFLAAASGATSNEPVKTSPQPAEDDWLALLRLVCGHWVGQAVHVAAKLGVADLLGGRPEDASSTCRGHRLTTRKRFIDF